MAAVRVKIQFELECSDKVVLDASFAQEAIAASFDGKFEGQLWLCGDLGVWQSYPAGTEPCEGPYDYKVSVSLWQLS